MTAPIPPPNCPGRLGCAWSSHHGKHFPHRGLTAAHTKHGPAKYLPGTTADRIRQLETATAQSASSVTERGTKVEYVRRLDIVIGWDAGLDATVSFVECSGGDATSRSYHGRPMALSNHKLRGPR